MTRQKGFTLIEIIITLAVSAILIIPITTILMSSIRNNDREQERIQSLSSVRAIAQIIEIELRESNQNIILEQRGECVLISEESEKPRLLSTYCLRENVLYRNGNQLGDKILKFDISLIENEDYLNIVIEDVYGGEYKQLIVFRY